MQIARSAIQNPQFTITFILLMALVGIASFFTMPRSEDPQFDLPVTIIEVVYPGTSPLDIENLVVDPLEDEINELENIKKIESRLKNGGVRLIVEFLYGTNPDDAYDKVKQAVASVRSDLPAGIQELAVIKATPRSVAVMQLALWSEPIDYKSMEFYAKQIEKRLEAFPSVQKATLWGYPAQIVSINLDTNLLKHYGVSVPQLEAKLQSRSLNITPGFVDASERRFNIKASGNFNDIEELRNTIIASNDTFALKLSDVAKVEFDSLEPSYLASYKNRPVIFITLEQRQGSNIFTLSEQVKAEITEFKKSLPSSLKLEVVFDQVDSVEQRVDGFFENLLQGLIIVGLLSLVFLGLRESVVVILAIPLSFMVAIGWLDFAGFGLQQMSIVGLIIALGLLVDNAIVVTESIHRHIKQGHSVFNAAISGVSDVGWAVTSGTVTTMLAFLPMLLLKSDTGDFMRSMPVTVVLVLLASLIIALTLTPMLASYLFSSSNKGFKTLQHYTSKFADVIYAPLIQRLLKLKTLVLLLGLLSLVAMSSLFNQVEVSFFPKAEKPLLLIDIETQPNSSLYHTQAVMHEIAADLNARPLVKSVAMNIGSANPRIYYNELPRRGESFYGQMLVLLTRYDTNEVGLFIEEIRAKYHRFAKAKVSVKEFTQGPVTDQAVTFRIMGESIDDITRVALALEKKMATTEGLVNINNPIGLPNTELALAIDYDKAALSGIDIGLLDATVQTLLTGKVVGNFSDANGEDYPIVVKRHTPTVEGLSSIFITNNRGEQLPLSNVVDFKLQAGKADFYHYQKLRMAKVSADVKQGTSIKQVTEMLASFLSQYSMPPGVYFDVGGEEENRAASFAGLAQIMIITVVGILGVLVLQFRSFLQPLIVVSAIPFALVGSVLGLYLAGQSFSIMAFIGLISLFGIVVNNAIILIDSSNRFCVQGYSIEEAVVKASSTRLTPILITTLTTIGGLIPLTFLGGALWQPLGLVIISGLCVATLSSLLIVPVLTVILTRSKS